MGLWTPKVGIIAAFSLFVGMAGFSPCWWGLLGVVCGWLLGGWCYCGYSAASHLGFGGAGGVVVGVPRRLQKVCYGGGRWPDAHPTADDGRDQIQTNATDHSTY